MTKKGTFPGPTVAVGGAIVVAGTAVADYHGLYGTALISTGMVLAAGRSAYWYKRGRHGAAAMIDRWDRQTQRTGGVASRWERSRTSTRGAMRRRWARHLRPTLNRQADIMIPDVPGLMAVIRPAERLLSWCMTCWAVARTPVETYATYLGYDNVGGYYVPNNSVVVRIGAARSGKSAAMGCRIIDHRGPAIVTSTRKDLFELTGALREKQGPVYVFNAGDVGRIPSSLRWSVLAGCKDMDTAMNRANDLIGEAPDTDRQYWNDQAARLLGPLMYAAAHANLQMRVVARWVAAGGDEAMAAWRSIEKILRLTPDGAAALEGLAQFFSMVGSGDRTRLSITNTLMPALAWLANPRTAALGDAQGEDLFDVKRDLLDANATIYLLGARQRGVGALTGALVAEIVRQASNIAEQMPSGRLDPQLLLALDELPLTCPGPVQHWVKDMGGRGITMDLGVQQRAGLDEVWGVEGRRAILGNAYAVLLGPGCNDPIEVADWSKLSGVRKERRPNFDGKRNVTGYSTVDVPVVDHGKIMAIQLGTVIVYTRGRISEIKTPNAEARRDVRRALREQKRRLVIRPTSAPQTGEEKPVDELVEVGK